MKEVEEGRKKKWEGWEAGRRDKGWEEHKAEKNLKDRGCTFMYCTNSMTYMLLW